jgi:hypothetical protein
MAVISVAFEHGKEHGIVSENPVKGVKRVKRARDAKSANRPWTLDECRTVISSIPQQLRLPVALGMLRASLATSSAVSGSTGASHCLTGK